MPTINVTPHRPDQPTPQQTAEEMRELLAALLSDARRLVGYDASGPFLVVMARPLLDALADSVAAIDEMIGADGGL